MISRVQPRRIGIGEHLDERPDRARRNGEVVEPVPRRATAFVELGEDRLEMLLVGTGAGDGGETHAGGELVPDVLLERVARVPGDGVSHLLAKGLVARAPSVRRPTTAKALR